ncbi:hypothetical protein HK099_001803 [Clydaea vesicula]|uniref:CoA transferase n=1 Tax=Clydaea vesicula TaxID=447962 RepID=A0AAD5U6L2_9FUNG|nr:hypothetical protein HK099_001803 [Clydaea vesicula]KAJ3392727.1 hypothetical protein HDU92_008230 [Lobulomyces angularis]
MRNYANRSGSLDGIRVLDLTRILAGPFCTQILGDMGAEIIKVESKNGDDTRRWGPPFVECNDDKPAESAYFLGINRNKKSVTIDFKTEKGRDLIKKLAVKSDILIENFLPNKLKSFGICYEELKIVNPKLIYCSITGYGPDGPYSGKPGYDAVISAAAGLMHITGEEGGTPVKVGVAITDVTTGLYAHGAVLAALYKRTLTGKGQKIDVSLLETQVATLVNVAHDYLLCGVEGTRMGTSHPSIVPYQCFRTKDSYIMVGVGNDKQFASFCEDIETAELASNPKFRTNALRVANRKELVQLLNEVFAKKTTKDWENIFNTKNAFPFSKVNNIKETFENEQVLHRNMVVQVKHPRIKEKLKLVGIPVKFSDNISSIRLPPPALGQHSQEVLSEVLDISTDDIQKLILEGVI